MDYGGYYWGLCWDYYRDPFPHSLDRIVEPLNPKPNMSFAQPRPLSAAAPGAVAMGLGPQCREALPYRKDPKYR